MLLCDNEEKHRGRIMADKYFYSEFIELQMADELETEKEKINKNDYIDLNKFPEPISEQVRAYLYGHSFFILLKDLPEQKFYLDVIAEFLNDEFPQIDSLLNMDIRELKHSFRVWLYGLRFKKIQNQFESMFHRVLKNPKQFTETLELICLYAEVMNPRDEFEKDIWSLERLSFPCRNNEISPGRMLNFTRIHQNPFREQVKQVFRMWIKEYAVNTLKGRIGAINKFSEFLYQHYRDVEEAGQMTRNIIEDYLIHDAIAESGKSCRKNNITTLKCLFVELGKISEAPFLQEIIVNSDIPSVPRCKFNSYTEEEQRLWSNAVEHMNEQVGRALVLHMLLGTRISEVLTLKQNCVERRGNVWWIRIDAQKSRHYHKPITDEIKMLIDKAIDYTRTKYNRSLYVFVNSYNSEQPMMYSTIRKHMIKIIKTHDLRDRNGELFSPKTHIFRHCYGVKLTEMHLDDLIIAKLLGHANTDSLPYYRKIGNKIMAEETRKTREAMDILLLEIIKTWGEEYERLEQMI